MATFTIKKGDTLPVLAAVLKDGAAVAIDVSGATSVKFRMRKEDGMPGTRKLDKAVDFTTNGSDGACEVSLTASDTDTEGNFIGEFVIDWGGGDVQTVPSDDYVRVKVVPII